MSKITNKPVVGHVALDKVSSSQGSHQGELPCQDGGTDYASQLTGVLTRTARTGTLNTEHLESTDIQLLIVKVLY